MVFYAHFPHTPCALIPCWKPFNGITTAYIYIYICIVRSVAVDVLCPVVPSYVTSSSSSSVLCPSFPSSSNRRRRRPRSVRPLHSGIVRWLAYWPVSARQGRFGATGAPNSFEQDGCRNHHRCTCNLRANLYAEANELDNTYINKIKTSKAVWPSTCLAHTFLFMFVNI